MVLISFARLSGGADLKLPLALALGLIDAALDPELVWLLGYQLGHGGTDCGHLEGARKAWEKAASCAGNRLPMRSCSGWMVGRSKGAS